MAAPTGTAFGRTTYSAYAGYTSGLHANLIVQKWRAETFKVMMNENPFLPFMGADKDDTNVFQVRKNFTKEKGDKETFTLRALLTGDGQGDDGAIDTNEETMAFYDDSVTIHQRIHGVQLNGEMSEQRTIVDLRNEAKVAIGEWGGRAVAADMVSALSGQYTLSFDGQTSGDRAVDASSSNIDTVNMVAPSTGRIFYGGQTTAGQLSQVTGDVYITSADTMKFGTLVISKVKLLAKKTIEWGSGSSAANVVPIRPLKGKGYDYVMFIHPLQYEDLKQETAWLNAQKDAALRGPSNILFRGTVNNVVGVWDGVLIVVSELINNRKGDATGADTATYFDTSADACASGIAVARALFCGAQAGLISWGKLPDMVEDPRSKYTRKYKVNSSMIYGVKKAQFNSRDFGVYVVDTAITIPTS